MHLRTEKVTAFFSLNLRKASKAYACGNPTYCGSVF